ncbi:hypothetical protein Val02_57650 [Virgisporangium aliadipatigenens]|uniref:Integrase n=1 Tax=Virgisporangium aliadipatigenens TaxID=741659 RepID=A0A8J4DSN0_9ACTN|nr:hypothetical protein Val02_57650 [Virgisporangium aliadipatigenens]
MSTWFNGGVSPTDIVEWAGQSLEVLLRIYAKCLDRSMRRNRRLIEAALGHESRPKTVA